MAEPASTAGDDPLAIVARTVKVSRVLKIGGYKALKGFPTGASCRAPAFTVGNQYWNIMYFPNGDTEGNAEYISVFLFRAGGLAVPVMAVLRLESSRPRPRGGPRLHPYDGIPPVRSRHKPRIPKVSVLLHVRGEDSTAHRLPLPPPASGRHLGDLLQSGEGADVTFLVDGERFRAHRCILAAWSPVFRAGLWGSTRDGDPRNTIDIQDMSPEVFKVMLRFIYTERLPAFEPEEKVPMLQHLLVASDRFDIEQLKRVCEIFLCQNLHVELVASTLALAEQHGSMLLKERCLRYIEAPGAYETVIKTEDFRYLSSNFPELVVELLSRVGPRIR
ncbi:unnamed protein product [Alopecurus aequalis]